MTKWWMRLGALLLAALVTTALVSLGHSLFVQSELAALGTALPIHVRLGAILRDFIGLLPTLGAIVLGALLIAFLIAGWLRPRAGRLAPFAYPLAGWAAIALALFAMRLAYGFSPLAGARTGMGFLVMSLGGLGGGLLFSHMLGRIRR
mgnify:CR=1 FL=1|jgi:hypothetical protein